MATAHVHMVGLSFWNLLLGPRGRVGLLCLGYYALYIVPDSQALQPATARYVDFGIATYFLLLNLLSALLYYALKYEPRGTSKPTWTDQFG